MNSFATNLLPTPKEFDDITKANFTEKVVSAYQPAIIRGFADSWELVKSARHSSAAAARHIASFANNSELPLVTLPDSCKGRLFYNEQVNKLNFSVRKAKLQECFVKMKMSSEKTGMDKYCIQSVRVKDHFPGLAQELNNPLLPSDNHPFIWLGNDLTVAPHFDEASNIAVVVAGKRRFTLFPPDQIANLYIGPVDFTPAGQPISMVDLANPDLNKYPKYREAYKHGMSAELHAGDAIYIPTPWWHHVQSLSDFNVLINYWWSNAYERSELPFPMLLHTIQALKHLPREQRQAWQQFMHYYLFDENIDTAEHLPTDSKGFLGEFSHSNATQMHSWLVDQLK